MGCINSSQPHNNPNELSEFNKPNRTYSIDPNKLDVLLEKNNEDIKDFNLNGINTWAKVVDVYDGDTCRLLFYLNSADILPTKVKTRGIGYNCPEVSPPLKHTQRDLEKAMANKAKNRFLQLVTNQDIDISKNYTKKELAKILKVNTKLIYVKFGIYGKYGRILTEYFTDKHSEKSINQILIDEGYAIKYSGGTRDKFVLTVPYK